MDMLVWKLGKGNNHKNFEKMKKCILIPIVLIFTGLFGFAQNSSKKSDEILIKNAKVYTSNPKMPWAEAFVVKDSKIIFVGTTEEAKKVTSKKAKVINAKGKLILPGLIDSHTHPGLVSWFSDKFTALPNGTIKAKLAWLKNYVKQNPNIPFILAGSWNWYEFDKNGPNKKELDEISTNIPIVLMEGIGHSFWVNSKMLEILGVEDDRVDGVPNLSYYHKDKTGEFTGWIKEFIAMPNVIDKLKEFKETTETPDYVLSSFLNFLSSKGVTTIFDAGNFNLNDDIYSKISALDKEGKLPVRYEGSYHIYRPSLVENSISELKKLRKKYETENLHFNTIKIHFDGIFQIRTAAVKQAYNDDAENFGNTLLSEEQFTKFLIELNKEKIDVHLHTIGDQAIHIALNSYEKLKNLSGAENLHTTMTISHLAYIDPVDISRVKKLGVIANYTPQWFGNPETHMHSVIGDRNMYKMEAATMIETGAVVSFSSDLISPIILLRANPFLGIQVGHNRQDLRGGENAPLMIPKEERLRLEQLIKGYTINGALQLGLDDKIGSIEVGKDADFVILKDNLFEVDRYEISNIKVSCTYKKGKLVYKRSIKDSIYEYWLKKYLTPKG